ncbi:MAG TPA: nucleotide sugar dehydrogenase [Xanthobacteraceae bacterium]|nr:nucleotide sugar dehydrogenase [Xanthobacteraceae bacterium]
MTKPVVGFAGMTHLGIVSATGVASAGFETVCFDPDAALVMRLKTGQLPVVEPGLNELLASNGSRQSFTADRSELARCDVVYVSPDVATDDQGQSDTTMLRDLVNVVASVLNPNACMVVLSQVEPGFTRALKSPSQDRLYYQVETLVFGRAVERAIKPERYIIGCADPEKPLNPNFRTVLEAFDCPILPMRYESAELAKISINCCLVASVSVANTLAGLCEQIGADWSEIAPALKLDRRIGPHAYLSPGLGIAGGNLERDLATVCRLAEAHDTDAGVVKAWIHNSHYRRDWVVRTIRSALLVRTPDAVLAVWGLAYKENTHSIKNSPSLATIAQLPQARLRVHDPVVSASVLSHAHVDAFTDPLEAARGADALLVMTPWPQFRNIVPAQVAKALKGRIVIDPCAVLDSRAAADAGLAYYTLGRPAPDAGSTARRASVTQN